MNPAIRHCLLLLALVSFSPPVLAAALPPAVQVLGIEVGDANALYLRLSADTECGSPLAVMGKAQPHYREMFDMALFAYSTGRDIRVWVSSCDAQRRGVIVRMALGTV
jgi:hypothetical protein